MIKIGERKKYKDIDGTVYVDEVIFVSEFNYITTVTESIPNIGINARKCDLIKFLGMEVEDIDYSNSFVIHNKEAKDVNIKYRAEYKEFMKESRKKYTEFNGFYDMAHLNEIPICLNLTQLKRYYNKKNIIELITEYYDGMV